MNDKQVINSASDDDLLLEEKFCCVPCREGLLIIKANFEKSEMTVKELLSLKHAWLLPNQKTSDKPLPVPPLSIDLSREQLNGLLLNSSSGATNLEVVAATMYGPTEQDKENNEDFALSGIITSRNNDPWAFTTVSDGVSTRTFWANRTSRIAALAAYQAFYHFIVERDSSFDEETELEKFREYLTSHIIDSLRKDQIILNSESGFIPSNWSPELYENYKDRDEFWYNATLLCACLGPDYGIILYAGDGGIDVAKFSDELDSNCEVIHLLCSTEETRIDNFVSLNVTPQNFRIARINYGTDKPCRKIEVCLSSDGVDRTLQFNEIKYQNLNVDSSEDAYRQLDELAQKEKKDLDNYSLTKITLTRFDVLPTSAPKIEAPIVSDTEADTVDSENNNGVSVKNVSLEKKTAFVVSAIVGTAQLLFLILSFLAGRYYFPSYPSPVTPISPAPNEPKKNPKNLADDLQEQIDSALKFSNDDNSIVINGLLVDRTLPLEEFNKRLEKIAGLLKQYNLVVTIYGYADGEASRENTMAGQTRADHIKKILEDRQVPKGLLRAASLGGVKYPIKDEKDSTLNRAVDICVERSQKSRCPEPNPDMTPKVPVLSKPKQGNIKKR